LPNNNLPVTKLASRRGGPYTDSELPGASGPQPHRDSIEV
jgi:hypothetical protein